MINIVRCFTFGNKPLFSVKNNKINETANKLMTKEQKFLVNSYHFPLGYEIKNISNKIIKNIKIPEYKFKNNKWVGEIKAVSLNPEEYLVLPTKYLMLLLFEKSKEDIYIDNGKMVSYLSKLDCNSDLDAYLTNFIFEPKSEWKDLIDPTENIFYYRIMSYFKEDSQKLLDDIKFDEMQYYMIEPEMLSLFGNFSNKNISLPISFLCYFIRG